LKLVKNEKLVNSPNSLKCFKNSNSNLTNDNSIKPVGKLVENGFENRVHVDTVSQDKEVVNQNGTIPQYGTYALTIESVD